MEILGTHHVAIICSDIARSRDFYSGVLGLPVVNELFREERNSHKVDLRLPDGTCLELFTFPGSPPRASFPEAQGLRHLALKVSDIEQSAAELRNRGIEVEAVRTDESTGKRFTFFADPDGLPLELYEAPDEQPWMKSVDEDADISALIKDTGLVPGIDPKGKPWVAAASTAAIIQAALSQHKQSELFVHRTATIEAGAVIKPPAVISAGCFVAANSYLRGGVYLGENVSVGPGCEVKGSIIFPRTRLAHLNFVGDSVLGRGVNFEAGAHTANHWNEREEKEISVRTRSGTVTTGLTKFGAIVGDDCRIGANSVLSPGTILLPQTVVPRLTLVEQQES